jgi:hypothetical protein
MLESDHQGSLGTQMQNYSIIKIGNEYVVRASGKNILRVASRRQAAQLVISANELLNSLLALPADIVPSIAPDASAKVHPELLADPSEAS